MRSFIAAIAICLAAGVAVVAFVGTDAGASCLDGCVMLLLLLAVGSVALFFLGLFGFGCMAAFASA